MKIIIKQFILFCLILTLASCSAKYEKYYEFDFSPNKDSKQCIAQCVKTKTRCTSLCTNNDVLCKKNSTLQAQLEYQSYVKEKTVEGGTINRDLDSYYAPLQCSKISCDCEADYRACYQMCGGVVKVKQRCIANCPD